MELIQPKADYWRADGGINAHIARCAKVCYASDTKSDPDKFVDSLIARGHKSVLRHTTIYYKIPTKVLSPMDRQRFICSPYCGLRKNKGYYYISTNGQYHIENMSVFDRYSEYLSDESAFKDNPYTAELIRMTFCIDTQISTTRELNRVSPNAITEQSTRYVDFNKKGLKICVPHWYNNLNWFGKFIARSAWRIESFFYKIARKFLMPQDAREFLPLVAATRVVYTYNIIEWRHILDLRLFGKTGKPHPNAKSIATQVQEQMIKLGYKFNSQE